jgi:hypothetical protein
VVCTSSFGLDRTRLIEQDTELGHSSVPRLYAVGLSYQRSIASHLLGGVGADPKYIVDHLTTRTDRPGTSH